MSSQQDENLSRVTARIGVTIRQWYALRVKRGQLEFHAEDMRSYVTGQVGEVAPGSPDRVMRALRKARLIGYRVLNRSQSLYRIEPPPEDEEPPEERGVRVQLPLF